MTRDVNDPAFPHGTDRGYGRGCRKPGCCNVASNAAKRRSDYWRATVGPLIVDGTDTRAHITRLRKQGATVEGIADAAALHWSAVHYILHDETRGVRRTTRAAVLRVGLADALESSSPKRIVSSKRATQQVRSLMALGWEGRWIATRLGYPTQTQVAFISQRREFITFETACKVDRLAREVGDRRGPSRRSVLRAKRMGWHPPGAYDEHGDLIPGAARIDDRAEAAAEAREQREADYARIIDLYERGAQQADIIEATGLSRNLVYAAVLARQRAAG